MMALLLVGSGQAAIYLIKNLAEKGVSTEIICRGSDYIS